LKTLIEEFINENGKVYGDLEYLVVFVSRANEHDDDAEYLADIFRKDQLVYAVGEWVSRRPNDIDTCEIYKVSEDEYHENIGWDNRSDDIKNFIADKEPIITFDGIEACDLTVDFITKYHPDEDPVDYELDDSDIRHLKVCGIVKHYVYHRLAEAGIKIA
jgi:hypothetical protein